MEELASNKEWKKWGESDPLYGVASWSDKSKYGASPWTSEEFYQLGASDWLDFRKHLERYGLSSHESCLEIGCGAGRITKQLALYFKQVHAVDVSEKMIEYAMKHITDPRVCFHVSKGLNIPLDNQSVNCVFSTHVFQHLDSLDIAKIYFKEITRVLQRNGTMMIHLPIYKWPSSSRGFSQIYAVRKKLSDYRAGLRRMLMGLGLANPIMRGLWYPVDMFYQELPKLGFEDIEISIFITKSNNDPHPFVLARKT